MRAASALAAGMAALTGASRDSTAIPDAVAVASDVVGGTARCM